MIQVRKLCIAFANIRTRTALLVHIATQLVFSVTFVSVDFDNAT